MDSDWVYLLCYNSLALMAMFCSGLVQYMLGLFQVYDRRVAWLWETLKTAGGQ